jgi:hypothetical protein
LEKRLHSLAQHRGALEHPAADGKCGRTMEDFQTRRTERRHPFDAENLQGQRICRSDRVDDDSFDPPPAPRAIEQPTAGCFYDVTRCWSDRNQPVGNAVVRPADRNGAGHHGPQ